jgi:hypothetical protein
MAGMSWSLYASPLHDLDRDGMREWAAAGQATIYGLPDTPAAPRPLPLVADVLGAFRLAGCHGSFWYAPNGVATEVCVGGCVDRILCNPSVGWYLGEVTLAAPPPLEDLKLLELDTPVCFLSFRNPNQSAVLHAMYALSRVAGPMFVFAEKKFVVSPEDSMDRMAAHWPW